MEALTYQLNTLSRICDTDECELIEGMVLCAADYVQAVITMETKAANFCGRQGAALRDAVSTTDATRSKVHDSLIARVNVVNRICASHGQPPIYAGDSNRRHYADFAIALVDEIFSQRR